MATDRNTRPSRRRAISNIGCALAAPLIGVTFPTRAQSGYPARPVRLIVPFLAGGAVDVLARAIAPPLASRLGVSVLVENKPGASGIIGADFVAQSAGDGHTLLFGYDGTLVISPVVSKVPFDTMKDFAPITRLVSSPLIMAIGANVPARTFQELIAYSKRTPLTYGSSGTASTPHMFGELLKIYTGINWSHVPYKGAPAATTDVIGGHISAVATTLSSVENHIKSGQLRGIIVSGAKRSPIAPDTATVTELGFPEADAGTWFGVLAPAATPRPIVERLNHEIVGALQTRELRERLMGLGFEPIGNTPEQFREDLRADLSKWARVAKQANVRLE